MKILYFFWKENNRDVCIEGMRKLGHSVRCVEIPVSRYDYDESAMAKLNAELNAGYDCIFSFNYFPDVARVAKDRKVLYVSWVYDSPHITLESETLGYEYNRVFIFDRELVDRYRAQGFENVRHMPLAARVYERRESHYGRGSSAIVGEAWNARNDITDYSHEITFLGSLYDGDKDQYSRIKYLPDQLSGYLDGVMAAGRVVYGFDMVGSLVDDKICSRVKKYVNFGMSDRYRPCDDEIFRNMLRRHMTMCDRLDMIDLLGQHFNVDLYSGNTHEGLHVNFMGYADYNTQMPEIFASSKINLNISLRSILSGIPLRVLDILGAGGFCLTNYQSEFDDWFENGRELVWYEDMGDLLEKAAYYLEHDNERESIARAGQQAVRDNFTYEKVLGKIFEYL